MIKMNSKAFLDKINDFILNLHQPIVVYFIAKC